MASLRVVSALAATALTAVFVLGDFQPASAETSGEYNNLCVMGLALHKQYPTDCTVHAQYEGKTYCFGNDQAKTIFFKHPKENLERAETYYSSIQK